MERLGWIQTLEPALPEEAAAILSGHGPSSHIVPQPWRTAAAISERCGGACLVDAHGCREEADRVLALGLALGCVPPGESSRVAAALAAAPPSALVLVGDHLPTSAERDRLAGLASETRWVHLAWADWQAPDGAPEMEPGHAALAALPRGLPRGVTAGDVALRPSDPGHVALARPQAPPPLPPSTVAAVSVQMQGLLRLAEDAPLPDGATLADLFALRWLSLHDPSADAAARAAAAAARIELCWGQPGRAQSTLRRAMVQANGASESARARLDQADGDVLATMGDAAAATAAHDRAAARLRAHPSPALLLRFTRRRAERLLSRGQPDAARPYLRTARALARELGDPLACAAALRASGDAALAAGESLGAEALYEQAATTPVPSGEQMNRLLGEIGMALQRSERARAAELLARLPPNATGLARACALHRAAEHALSTGSADEADRAARQAADGFVRAGALVGQARAVRLQGDAQVLRAHAEDALRLYADALDIQVRVNDLAGARRTLAHAARVCADGGETDAARQLEALGAEL
ncbi:MAG: hypothetical protein VX000_14300 [Myxococcota bacterium]|nr:hypothetical protein [Myxococcota bacterium]